MFPILCVLSYLVMSMTLCSPMDCSSPGSSVHGIFLGKNIGVGCHFLLQGIFPTQGSNVHLLHGQADSYTLLFLFPLALEDIRQKT